MNMRLILNILVCLSLATLFGCGGGGGAASSGSPSPEASTVVAGKAVKGPIGGGTVSIYAVSNGTVDRSAPLGTFGPTPASGAYSIDIGSYTGPVLVEIVGGNYIDEATGAQIDITGVPLRAMVGNASGDVSAAVTALTEIAAKRVVDSGAPITAEAISAANTDVGSTFGVADIIGTIPVNAAVAGADTAPLAQQQYGVALAAVSKYMQLNSRTLGQSITDYTPPPTADLLLKLDTARTAFLADPERNQTSITVNTPATKAVLKLSTAGTLTAPATIGGIEVLISLPTGVSVPLADQVTGEVDAAAFTVSGVAPAGTSASGKFTAAAGTSPATIKLIVTSTAGFGTGEFVTITCNLASGTVVTQSDFSLTGFKAVNNVLTGGSVGAPISGITPALTATLQ
ncbi:hypothetical protein [Geobacter sp. DSM 9736]|uniref:hypothetical protein n=1 Tax=Geobacter sp. DSM 9736 TaxID=1277350 RepID=UPI000B503250|nr:hypothetical protein [Geobacter sp. DSM 9736]SNB46283.1 hypothetical protein SAMN06269301_1731 [Geobacter sp. DSM 9736]